MMKLLHSFCMTCSLLYLGLHLCYESIEGEGNTKKGCTDIIKDKYSIPSVKQTTLQVKVVRFVLRRRRIRI